MKLNPKKCVFGVRLGKFLGFMISNWGIGFMISYQGIEANLRKFQAVLDINPPRTIPTCHAMRGSIEVLYVEVCR